MRIISYYVVLIFLFLSKELTTTAQHEAGNTTNTVMAWLGTELVLLYVLYKYMCLQGTMNPGVWN